MKTKRPYRKFQLQQEKINELGEKSSRFKRIYSEYETISDELWNLETSEDLSVTDEFINSIQLQKSYLEEEIEDWLIENPEE